jgi:hypothetical protein
MLHRGSESDFDVRRSLKGRYSEPPSTILAGRHIGWLRSAPACPSHLAIRVRILVTVRSLCALVDRSPDERSRVALD